jgi:hypothetical protein
MKSSFGFSLLLGAALTAFAAMYVRGESLEGQKCDCFGGDATCFFDGSRCPVSGGRCRCFKSPGLHEAAHDAGCCSNHQKSDCCSSKVEVEFCSARCPEKVGGQTCGAQCRLEKGHCGQHLCIKLHDF